MTELQLHIAPLDAAPSGATQLNPGQLKLRIDSLPAFDLPLRLDGVLGLLKDVQRARKAPAQRGELLQVIGHEVDGLLSLYRDKLRYYSFPLPRQTCALHSSVQTLLAEASDAYKRLIMDLLAEPGHASNVIPLRDAILHCIEYTTQQALHAYAVYQPAPANIWQDLHCRYAYAERRQFAADRGGPQADVSIRGAYARLLLLSIANPHHLLLGEIYQVGDLLKKWALAVRLETPAAPTDVGGRFFCDLGSNGPPGFGIEGVVNEPIEPRLLNLDELLGIINKRMKVLALNHHQSLQLRSEWDLLLRLRTAWQNRRIRNEKRQAERGITVKAIVGLSNCHSFFTGYTPFEPEQSEITLHGSNFKQEQTLSLVPSDEMPWLDADVQSKLKSGVIKPRAYVFDLDNKENDIWKKAHGAGQRFDTDLEKNLEQRSLGQIFKFTLANASPGGTGLETSLDSPVQLRVGEMVAAFPYGEDDDGEPVLNVIRWLRCDGERHLHLGLRHIGGDIVPVALRVLEQDAHFQNYARGFILAQDQDNVSAIVPAGLFEPGNLILVNHDDHLESMQLKSIVQTTRAFAQFSCKALDADDQLSDYIVKSLKKLLRENTR